MSQSHLPGGEPGVKMLLVTASSRTGTFNVFFSDLFQERYTFVRLLLSCVLMCCCSGAVQMQLLFLLERLCCSESQIFGGRSCGLVGASIVCLSFTSHSLTMPSFRRHGKSDNMTLCAVGAMVMLTGVLLYMSMLLSPALFRGIIQDVVCDHQKQEYVGGGTDAQQRSLLQSQALTVAEMNRTHVVVEAEGRDHAHILIEASQVTVDCNCPASNRGSAVLRSRAGDASHKKVSILIGIFTTAPRAERRNLLRLAYGVQHSEHALVTVKFVVGRVKNSEEKILLGMEILHHNDVLVLDCEESINDGKSFTFFSTLAAQGTKYDYVMKADDDSYLRLDNLGRSLYRLPRIDVYYGYILPCENTDPHAWYMAGMGYVLSWDLVQWIHKSSIPRENSVGTEDQLIADWFNAGKKAKNRVNKKPLFYDHPDFGGQCSHELVPETVLIHQVKTQERWINVLSYFEEQRMVDLFRSTTQDSQPPS